MAADGSLIFNTKMDTSGFDKGTKQLSSKMLDLKNKVKTTENQMSSLQEELKNLSNTEVKTKISEQLERDIAKSKEKLKSLYAEADKIGDSKKNDLISMGFGTEHLDDILSQDKSWQKVQADIDKAEEALDRYEAELKRVRATESQIDPTSTAEYKTKEQKLAELTGQIEVYKAKLRETEEKESSTSSKTKKASNAFERLKKCVSKAGKSLSSAFKTGAVNLIKKIGSHAKKSASEMGGLSKAFNPIKQALQGMIIYQGISKIFDSIKDGMQNLAQASPETNENLSSLMTSLTYLKNTLATAFEPILNVVTPILTHFINMLTLVTDKIAQFMSALTGKETYTKAVKVQQDYAESIADTTSATEENTKATDENQKGLSGYDELNVMQDNSSTATEKGSTNEITPKDMFTTAAVSNGINGFANQLKDLFKSQDFSGIGELIGTKINSALKNIIWNKIRSTSKKWANNLAKFLNGAVATIDWNLVGSTMGNGLMTLFDFAYTFLTTFDFAQFGAGIANVLNGMFTSIDWATVGGTFGAAVQAAIATGFGFVTTFDWVNAGLSLSETVNGFFAEIDWAMAGQTLSDGILGMFATLTTFVQEVDWGQIGEDIGEFLINIDWWQIFLDLLDLLWSCVLGLWDLLKGLIGKMDLANWFRGLFDDIGGPLDDIFDFIGDLIDGFMTALGGLITFIDGVFSGDWEKAWSGICEFFEGIWDMIWGAIKYVINLIIGGINDLWTGIYTAVKGIVDGIGGIAGAIGDLFGQDWHFSMPSEPPLIPKLATGTVVPANYGEFLAVLGDNKREAEVVSPISAMKQAMSEVLAEFGGAGNGDITLTVNLDGRKIYQSVVDYNNRQRKRTGKSALA